MDTETTCVNCASPFVKKQKTQRFCCPSYRWSFNSTKQRLENPDAYKAYQRAYSKANSEKKTRAAREWALAHPERMREHHRKYRERSETKEAAKRYSFRRWHSHQSPISKRVVALFETMTDRQRARFADWLLRSSHPVIHVFAVDDWVAAYNSKEV